MSDVTVGRRDLDELRRAIDDAAQLPVPERVDAFDRINGALVDELALLDEL